jgi:uncharacterized repeat protein (TIGR03803 family)
MNPTFLGRFAAVLLVVYGINLTGIGRAQEEIILHNFGDGTVPNDGTASVAGLIKGSDGDFYGTTLHGGTFPGVNNTDGGTVFKLSPLGQVTILHDLAGLDNGTPADGANAQAPLLQGFDGNYYGTTRAGGSSNFGTFFKVTPQGQMKVIHSFATGSVLNDGKNPQDGLVQGSDGNFYGTTTAGGAANQGVVFKITPLGAVTVLHNFGDGTVTNDGATPLAGLIQAGDGNFYGTTSAGGSNQKGTVFEITLQGTVTILHSFADGSVANDGATPEAALVQSSDSNFYGTTFAGGTANQGTVFKITPQGMLTILHNFSDGTVPNDGVNPEASLILGADGNLYGTTFNGGLAGHGTYFKMTPQGVTTILHSCGDGSVPLDGINPAANLLQDFDGNFYGTTSAGGSANHGTIFKIVPNPPNISSALTAVGVVGQAFSYQIRATNQPTGYSATGLPDGLSIDSRTGVISGTPTTADASSVAVTITNASGSNTVYMTITISPVPAPVITSILNAFGSVNTAFTYTPTALYQPTGYTASNLPPGLNINANTGVITGSPTTPGTYPITLTASNLVGPGSVTLTITIFNSPPTLSQEYVVLHRFNDGSVTNDGQQPTSIFEASDGNFYGTTSAGGANGDGAIFKMNVQGTTSIFNSATSGGLGQSLVQGSDGNFYGTNYAGGANGKGFVFKLTPEGVMTILHFFSDGSVANDGANPNPGLARSSDGTLYGTTRNGGSSGGGTIFTISQTGTETVTHNFGDGSTTHDGLNPGAGLLVTSTGFVIGTTQNGGSAGHGAVYLVVQGGSDSILHSFGDNTVANDGLPGNANGAPALVEGTDHNVYGVTAAGGSAGNGCVYEINLNTGVTSVLHSFGDGSVTNDGANPVASLLLGYDGNFYGVTQAGGSAGDGTIFSITSTGTETIIHHFGDGTTANDGTGPVGSLHQGADGNFYGTTAMGGAGFGTVFQIVAMQTPTFPPLISGDASAVFTPGESSVYVPTVEAYADTSWTISGTLPPGLVFDPTSGTISGTPFGSDPPGVYVITITPTGGTPQTVTITIAGPTSITSPASATGSVGTPFTYAITASGSPTSFSASSLPSWLSVNVITGAITGTPPSAGIFDFSVTASNSAGTSSQQVALNVTGGNSSVPAISNPLAVTATEGVAFSYAIPAANNPTSFSALSVPATLNFNPISGSISGIPSEPGTYKIPVAATNGSGTSNSVLALTVLAIPAPVITSSLTASGVLQSPFSYQIAATGTVSDYNATGLPAGLSIDTTTGLIAGTPTASGTFPVTISAGNGTGTDTKTLSLTIASATLAFGNWESIYSFSGPAAGTPFNDGVPNLLKYLFDLNPSKAMSASDRSALPVTALIDVGGTEFLTLTFREYALYKNLTINLQTSSDLKTWTTVNPPNFTQQVGTDPSTGDPIMEIGVLYNGTGRQFIRLDVTTP